MTVDELRAKQAQRLKEAAAAKHPTQVHQAIAKKQTAIRHRHGTGKFKAPPSDPGEAIEPPNDPGEFCEAEPLDTPITGVNPWRPAGGV